jgi:2-amino-4-hydroxy-6-hydroxymethyldihydropteridine diphosphokinase
MTKIVLGIGSNIGNRKAYIRKAIELICRGREFDFLALSPIYETEPWGFKKQKSFLNCVLVCLSRLSPAEAMLALKRVEQKTGRKKRPRWQRREIDIDILFYSDRVIKSAGMEIPHSGIVNRNFVLKPLSDLMPEFIHPVLKKKIRALYYGTPDKSKVKLYSQKLSQKV